MTKGKIYELLSKEIFEIILNQSKIKNIDVQHNVIIKGKTTNHQIDVYWEFELGGVNYKTIVQAKNWNNKVPKGALLLFKEILDDIPGQPRGIFINSSGYQSGAAEVAKANGIDLMQLEKVNDSPIEIVLYGYAKVKVIPTVILVKDDKSNAITFMMEFTTYAPSFKNLKIKADSDWILKESELSKKITSVDKLKIKPENKNSMDQKIYDEKLNLIGDIGSIYLNFVTEMKKDKQLKQTKIIKFESPTFLKTANPELKFIKILSLTVDITITQHQKKKVYMKAPDIILFTLKNILQNKTEIIGKI